jgi:hypothetical protein
MTAFALPAAAVWGPAGALLGGRLSIDSAATRCAVGLALAYACAELIGFPLRVPSLAWQVPSAWVVGRSATRRLFVWGVFLGPGLLTRNQFASFWFVPIVILMTPSVTSGALVGLSAGFAHAVARASGVLANRRQTSTLPDLFLRALRWREIDGGVLAALAGLLVGYLV